MYRTFYAYVLLWLSGSEIYSYMSREMNGEEQNKASKMKEKQMTVIVETSDDSKEHSIEHPLTYTEALTNFLKFTIGTGIFAMGDAFKNSGLLAGCVLTAVIGIINAHCQHILLRHSEEYRMESEDKSPPDYARTIEISFQKGPEWLRPWAPASKKISNIFLCLMQFGTCAVYFVFISRNIQQVISLKKQMKDPSHFQSKLGVLNVGVSIMTVLMIAVGFLSYLKWGDNVEGSTTLNLPKESDVSLALQGILAITILLSVPLQFYVAMEILWKSVKGKGNGKWYRSELVLRIGLIIIIFVAAEVIPQLNIFISLVGSTCCITLVFIFPAILDLIATWGQSEKLNWMNIIKNSFIILFGLVSSITGTYEVLCAVVDLFN